MIMGWKVRRDSSYSSGRVQGFGFDKEAASYLYNAHDMSELTIVWSLGLIDLSQGALIS